MGKRFLLSAIFLGLMAFIGFSAFHQSSNPEQYAQEIVQDVQQNFKALEQAVEKLKVQSGNKESASVLRTSFTNVRALYKKNEFYIEYFFPTSAEELNGPLLTKVAFDDPNQFEIPPQGLQKLEELVFQKKPDYETIQLTLQGISGVLTRIKVLQATLSPNEVFNALQLELIRVQALGFAGFDATISENGIQESSIAFTTTARYVTGFANLLEGDEALKGTVNQLNTSIERAFTLPESFKNFNRAYFISKLFQPFYEATVELRMKYSFTNSPSSALNLNAKQLFSAQAFNTRFYSKFPDIIIDEKTIELGKLLFFDPILSGNHRRACASCHNPAQSFTDAFPKSIAFDEKSSLERNAPTILNAGIQAAQFWDIRANNLEDQIFEVLHNEDEMHSSFKDAVSMLNTSDEYKKLFSAAFKSSKDSSISGENIQRAIAAFEFSLVDFNAPFDAFVNGNDTAISRFAQQGFNLFMGKGKCGTCHFLPTFGGTVPPNYSKTEFEVLGTPGKADNTVLDEDLGVKKVSGKDIHAHAFKTPQLRNIDNTGPYMHNGVYKTLKEVLAFYKVGGGKGLDFEVPNQSLPSDKLKLKDKEIRAIIAFMENLSSTKDYSTIAPKSLPDFANADLNKRKIGGEY
jgi:cytochrome c peroxidase